MQRSHWVLWWQEEAQAETKVPGGQGARGEAKVPTCLLAAGHSLPPHKLPRVWVAWRGGQALGVRFWWLKDTHHLL